MTTPTQQQCENGENPLYEWCMKVIKNHGRCDPLCDGERPLDLLNFINGEIDKLNLGSPEGEQNLNNEINFYRRNNQNLKKFIEDKTDLANQRNLQILERKDKETYYQIIYYSILLIIAICFGIFCIYYYFNFTPSKV